MIKQIRTLIKNGSFDTLDELVKEKKIADKIPYTGTRVYLWKVEEYNGCSENPSFYEYCDMDKLISGKIYDVDYDGDIRIEWSNGYRNIYQASRCILITEENLQAAIEGTVNVQKKFESFDVTLLDKVVLPKKTKEDIVSVLKQHEHKNKLFEEWGLGDVIEYGRGMTMLFWGAPGTGKTWTAECIAKSFGTGLHRIDSSMIQSSEPGASNRNIKKAFAEATKKNDILFLDECDSLITDRASVGMIIGSEINTLLTEIERFEGILILSTNLIEKLDKALERRISLILEFKTPNVEQRKSIWEKLIPSKMPLNDDVNLDELATYQLTGGEIKNAVLNAARFAVSQDLDSVPKDCFEAAIKRILASTNHMGTHQQMAKMK